MLAISIIKLSVFNGVCLHIFAFMQRDTHVTSSSDIIQAQSLPENFEIDLQKKDVNPISLSRNIIPSKDIDNGRQSCQSVVNKNENEYGKSRGGSRVNKLHKPLSSRDDKKLAKSRLPHTNLEIHNIKIAQVCNISI